MYSVLLVDDNVDLLFLGEEFLSSVDQRFKIILGRSVQEALAILKKESVDVVVSDYYMPGLDGLDFLERLRRDGNSIPFVMFTGRGNEEIAMKSLNLGADYYIRKGENLKSQFEELARKIKSIIRNNIAEQELFRAEKTLRENEKNYGRIIENVSDSIVILDMEGNITGVTGQGLRYTGYTLDELQLMNITDFLDEAEREKASKAIKRVIEEGCVIDFETSVLSKGAKRIPVIINAIGIENKQKKPTGILCFFRDVSKYKQIEESLQASEEKYLILSTQFKILREVFSGVFEKWGSQLLEFNS